MINLKLNIILLYCSLFTSALSLNVFEKVELFNLTNNSEINKYWQEFKVEFNKSYSNSSEEEIRRQLFVNKLTELNEHNKKYNQLIVMLNSTDIALGSSINLENQETFSVGLNLGADLLPEEISKIFLGLKLPGTSNNTQSEIDLGDIMMIPDQIPDEFDWRDQPGVVGHIKNQYPCGNCWIFSSLSALESQIKIKQNRTVSLSEQNVFDCSDPYQRCDQGHYMNFAYDYIIKNGGVDTESSYPYLGYPSQCKYDPRFNGATMKSYKTLNFNQIDEEKLKRAIYTIGPIAITINTSLNGRMLNSWLSYKGGLYNHNECVPGADHAVTLVGYGKDDRLGDYFIIKNSWGISWGHNGYMYIARNKNMCGVGLYAVYPIV